MNQLVSYGQNPAQSAQDLNPKLEFRNPKQVQMSQARMFRISNFGFRISRRVLGSGFAGLGHQNLIRHLPDVDAGAFSQRRTNSQRECRMNPCPNRPL
jgi:hypothetical protein